MNKPVIGHNIILLDEVDSTNDYASNFLAKETAPEGLVVVAGYQSKGRGQIDNSWESEPGKNMLLSIILYPQFVEVENQFLISKFISLAIVDFLENYSNNISIKWPNDIYYRDEKIAGILIENTIMGTTIQNTITGIGININQSYFTESLPNPVSLNQIKNKLFDLQKLLTELILHLNNRYKQLKKGNYALLNNDYLKNLYLLNKMHTYRDDESSFEGKIIGISKEGRLIIQSQDGKNREFSFKEVVF